MSLYSLALDNDNSVKPEKSCQKFQLSTAVDVICFIKSTFKQWVSFPLCPHPPSVAPLLSLTS